MKKRTYKKYNEVYNELLERCHEAFANGVHFLSPERQLHIELGCSRMTLRKALSVLEENSLIIRKDKRTEIIWPVYDLSRCGKIVLLASSRDGTIQHFAIERLYNRLTGMILSSSGEYETLLYDHNSNEELILSKLATAQIIIQSERMDNLTKIDTYLNAVRFNKKIVINILDEFEKPLNLVSLDNEYAGMLAGSLLYRSGVKKIIFLCTTPQSESHSKRLDGAYKYLKGKGINDFVFMINDDALYGPKYALNCHDKIRRAIGNEKCGIFATSDEWIDIMLSELFEENLVPNQVKVLTLDGCGCAKNHNPPLSYIGHATDQIADEIFEQIKLIATNNFISPLRKLIHPKFFDNGTL